MEERRIRVIGAASVVKWYVVGICALAALTTAGVVLVAAYAPADMITAINATLIGITVPIIQMLIGLSQRATAVAMDGKLSMLVQAKEEKAKLEGKIEGLKENPNTNIS